MQQGGFAVGIAVLSGFDVMGMIWESCNQGRGETGGSPGVPWHRLKSFFREWSLLSLLSCQPGFIGLLPVAAVKCVTAAPDCLCHSQQGMVSLFSFTQF